MRTSSFGIKATFSLKQAASTSVVVGWNVDTCSLVSEL